MSEQRFANTDAARMLAAALRSASQERGLSLREIGRRLGYKQPVVLSHMASGRVLVPTDRALAIAKEVGLPRGPFLEAVLHQHHPSVEWALIGGRTNPFMLELEGASKKSISDLSEEHRRVILEAVVDNRPGERWISEQEVFAVKLLRQLFPSLSTSGLSDADQLALELAVELTNADDAPKASRPETRKQ